MDEARKEQKRHFRQMLVRMWSNENTHSLLTGIKNGIAALENSSVVSYEVNQIHTLQLSNSTPRYLPSEKKTTFPQNPAHECLWKPH